MAVIKVLIALLILCSSLYMTDFFQPYTRLSIAMLCLFIIFFSFFNRYKILINWKLLFTVYFFILFGLLSVLFNSDLSSFIGILGIFLVIGLLTFVIPEVFRENTTKLITKIILITHIPLIILSLVLDKPIKAPFQGIFYNPNSFGTVVATLYSVNLGLLLMILDKGNVSKRKSLSCLLSLVVLFLLVMLSGSRTSLITSIVVSIIGIFVLIIRLFKTRRLLRFTKVTLLGMTLIYFVFIAIKSLIPSNVYTYIIYKFLQQTASGDILSGRRYIWNYIIDNASLIGGGSNYLGEIEIGAHNTFLGLLGEYGVITAGLFIIFLMVGLKYAIKYIFISDDFYKYVPMLMLLTFILLSQGEGMLYKLSMISSMIFIGHVSKYKNMVENIETLQVRHSRNLVVMR